MIEIYLNRWSNLAHIVTIAAFGVSSLFLGLESPEDFLDNKLSRCNRNSGDALEIPQKVMSHIPLVLQKFYEFGIAIFAFSIIALMFEIGVPHLTQNEKSLKIFRLLCVSCFIFSMFLLLGCAIQYITSLYVVTIFNKERDDCIEGSRLDLFSISIFGLVVGYIIVGLFCGVFFYTFRRQLEPEESV